MDLPFLDVPAALKRLDGDRELYADLVHIFHEDAPELWRQANGSSNCGDLVSGIHRLQNVAASIGALRAAAFASEIVELAREGREAEARRQLPGLKAELTRIEEALASQPWSLTAPASI